LVEESDSSVKTREELRDVKLEKVSKLWDWVESSIDEPAYVTRTWSVNKTASSSLRVRDLLLLEKSVESPSTEYDVDCQFDPSELT